MSERAPNTLLIIVVNRKAHVNSGRLAEASNHEINVVVDVSNGMINKVDLGVVAVDFLVQIERELVVRCKIVVAGAVG